MHSFLISVSNAEVKTIYKVLTVVQGWYPVNNEADELWIKQHGIPPGARAGRGGGRGWQTQLGCYTGHMYSKQSRWQDTCLDTDNICPAG